MKKIGLYIHFPFCKNKCPYCDFYSVRTNDAEMDRYTSSVIEGLDKYKSDDIVLDTIYFGGGTPSTLGTDRLVSILKAIHSKFEVCHDSEITLELNPTSSELLDFELLKKYGVNRLSVGMQSAVESEMKLLGRKHTRDDVVNTVRNAQKSGISNISLDLIIGVPTQTKASLKDSMDFCKSLDVKHISADILKVEEGTPFYAHRDSINFLTDDEQATHYEFVCDYLEGLGYNQYEISNFSLPGYESRHNNKYWRCEEYIGIGPSAYSFYNGRRFHYDRSFDDFYNDITVDEGIGGDEEEFIMLNLRLKRGLIFKEYENRFNERLSDRFISKAKLFEKAGFLHIDEKKVSLTKKGYLVSNAIISELI